MAEKSGSWFLELILNVLLLGAVAFVTFASRGEQERGVAVPLFAAVAPGMGAPIPSITSKIDDTAKKIVGDAGTTAAKGLDAARTAADQGAKALGTSTRNVGDQAGQSFSQAWGALQIWAAGLDGKITQDELNKILGNVQNGWSGTQSARDYLKTVNDRINSGQTEQVINEALSTLAQQANDKKMEVINSVVQFMRDNGISWDQTQQIMSKWVTEVLKLRPLDLWQAIKP